MSNGIQNNLLFPDFCQRIRNVVEHLFHCHDGCPDGCKVKSDPNFDKRGWYLV